MSDNDGSELRSALHELERRFPDIVVAYWERSEFDYTLEGESPLTDGEWSVIRSQFTDRVYSAVGTAEQIYYATSQDITRPEAAS